MPEGLLNAPSSGEVVEAPVEEREDRLAVRAPEPPAAPTGSFSAAIFGAPAPAAPKREGDFPGVREPAAETDARGVVLPVAVVGVFLMERVAAAALPGVATAIRVRGVVGTGVLLRGVVGTGVLLRRPGVEGVFGRGVVGALAAAAGAGRRAEEERLVALPLVLLLRERGEAAGLLRPDASPDLVGRALDAERDGPRDGALLAARDGAREVARDEAAEVEGRKGVVAPEAAPLRLGMLCRFLASAAAAAELDDPAPGAALPGGNLDPERLDLRRAAAAATAAAGAVFLLAELVKPGLLADPVSLGVRVPPDFAAGEVEAAADGSGAMVAASPLMAMGSAWIESLLPALWIDKLRRWWCPPGLVRKPDGDSAPSAPSASPSPPPTVVATLAARDDESDWPAVSSVSLSRPCRSSKRKVLMVRW